MTTPTSPRERMLATIRASIAANRAFLEGEMQRMPHTPPPYVHPPADDLVAQFRAEAQQAGAQIHHCTDSESALEAIQQVLQAHAPATVLAWDLAQIGLPGLEMLLEQQGITRLDPTVTVTGESVTERNARLHRLEPAAAAITGADVGIAESGTLALLSGAGRGRLTALLPPVHIAVLRADRLVRGLGAAFDALRAQYGSDPLADHANLTLITGPSRTGDIEMLLTVGIHGPGELHIVLLDERSAAQQGASQ